MKTKKLFMLPLFFFCLVNLTGQDNWFSARRMWGGRILNVTDIQTTTNSLGRIVNRCNVEIQNTGKSEEGYYVKCHVLAQNPFAQTTTVIVKEITPFYTERINPTFSINKLIMWNQSYPIATNYSYSLVIELRESAIPFRILDKRIIPLQN